MCCDWLKATDAPIMTQRCEFIAVRVVTPLDWYKPPHMIGHVQIEVDSDSPTFLPHGFLIPCKDHGRCRPCCYTLPLVSKKDNLVISSYFCLSYEHTHPYYTHMIWDTWTIKKMAWTIPTSFGGHRYDHITILSPCFVLISCWVGMNILDGFWDIRVIL